MGTRDKCPGQQFTQSRKCQSSARRQNIILWNQQNLLCEHLPALRHSRKGRQGIYSLRLSSKPPFRFLQNRSYWRWLELHRQCQRCLPQRLIQDLHDSPTSQQVETVAGSLQGSSSSPKILLSRVQKEYEGPRPHRGSCPAGPTLWMGGPHRLQGRVLSGCVLRSLGSLSEPLPAGSFADGGATISNLFQG